MSTLTSAPTPRPMDGTIRLVDRLFRIFGVLTIVGVGITIYGAMNAAPWWRPVFSLSHLTALIALVPLGVALIVLAYREAGSLGAMVSGHSLIVGALLVIAVSVTITLVEFNGNRTVRRISNFTTGTLVVLLVVHYFRWFRARFAGR